MILPGWQAYLKRESSKEYYIKLTQFLDLEYQTKMIFPIKENLFKSFELCDFHDVKVVILGQDPYHQKNQSMGLAFSVPDGVKIPPSLVNIYKELTSEYHQEMPKSGDLTHWAKQGVLLLNTIMSVEEGKPLSHKGKGWELFTSQIIRDLDADNTPKVFILWGNYARLRLSYIKNPNHLVLMSSHPSPLSAYVDFFGSKPFSKANNYLKLKGLTTINWL